MTAYYNENDRHAAAALRQLISDGLIAPGDVDERSIKDVQPDDVKGYEQVHWFAGGGGWSVALRLAGIPDDFAIWTGSPPCQPFSVAGQKRAFDDDRHLWPEMLRLVDARRPCVVAGEQVADAIDDGWLDVLFDDLEAIEYAGWSAVLPACAVGSPTERKRLFWLADSAGSRRCRRSGMAKWSRETARGSSENLCDAAWPDGRGSGSTLAVADVLQPSHGLPGRVAALRIIGNSIVPQVAAAFIQAYLEASEEVTEPRA